MLDLGLNSIKVENFRSISGTIVVPVDAPVVLIHGPNGAGKSSLVSAIALSLGGGEVPGLAEPRYLVHHNADRATIELGTSAGAHSVTIARDDQRIPDGVLEPKTAAFFAERCYLEQTMLTRLLEVYQERTAGEDSPLTRFVKELLRLDELDALIDGLHTAGDLRRVRRDVPEFAQTEAKIEEQQKLAAGLERQVVELDKAISNLRGQIRPVLVALDAEPGDTNTDPSDRDELQGWLEDDLEDSDKLDRLQVHLRRASDLAKRWDRLAADAESVKMQDAATAELAAREQHERWRQAHGRALEALITELRVDFPQLPSVDSALPSEAFATAMSNLDAEIARLDAMLADDAATVERLEAAQAETSRARARLETLDRELADGAAVTQLERLAGALANIAPHVADDRCPVCGREFAEVSDRPLAAHLAEEISRLSAQAARLQSIAKARLETTADLQRTEANVALLLSRQLSLERRSEGEARRSRHSGLRQRLREHEQGALDGGGIMRDVVEAQSTLARVQNRNRANVDVREEIAQLVAEASPQTDVATQPPSGLLGILRTSLSEAVEATTARRDQRALAANLRRALIGRVAERKEMTKDRAQVLVNLRRRRTALAESRQRMMQARALLQEVESTRTSIVGSVFNSALNKVWADLFVRLTPDEPYVPAFCEPEDAVAVTAELETRRRDGSRGGSPRAMLSAGNLNTAALTLFLALHLSVSPRVPWLLLDDPVQSMDEVHIAQFAALLRTLTQQHDRRLFIAVHERALFEYLALELSPATHDSSLITIELRRQRDGGSEVNTEWRRFDPDTALGAA